MFNNKSNGVDPGVMEAIQRLTQTQLSPMEEVLFQSWLKSNQVENTDGVDFDFRKLYRDSNGKVFPHGELNKMAQQQSDIQSIMKAQEAHDAASPIQALMGAGKTSMDTPSAVDNSSMQMPTGMNGAVNAGTSI